MSYTCLLLCRVCGFTTLLLLWQLVAVAHLCRFLHASDSERSSMFKMIPHIQTGPWLLKQTVGCTPCIVGRKLATTYYVTDRYVEIDLDVTTCKTAGYIVQVCGAWLDID
eukprot:GHRR01031118.1.p3 GENE.GHRR01031118.1~~GHRR01031118.1.p3  ORF type:complete len:110 (+),score=20.18 GHRR01031118.1:271-600(+)